MPKRALVSAEKVKNQGDVCVAWLDCGDSTRATPHRKWVSYWRMINTKCGPVAAAKSRGQQGKKKDNESSFGGERNSIFLLEKEDEELVQT